MITTKFYLEVHIFFKVFQNMRRNILRLRKYHIDKKLLVFLTAVWLFGLFKIYLYVKVDLRIYEVVKNDFDVDTGDYQSRYAEYNRIKTSFKLHHDQKYAKHKRILDSLGDRSSLGQLNKSTYLLIEYTTIFRKHRFCSSQDIFIKECAFKNCHFTCDKSKLELADGLFFHLADLEEDIKRDSSLVNQLTKLHMTHPEKLFVLYNDEANKVRNTIDSIKFNWTLSYRLDAEISDCSYGCFYNKKTNHPTENELFHKQLLSEFVKRDYAAVWFVSNCNSEFRIDFAVGLSQFLNLKAFGKCAWEIEYRKMFNFFLNSNIITNTLSKLMGFISNKIYMEHCGTNSLCELNQVQANMFYLSFESKNCTSYITEKFWRILRTNLIPVVIQPPKLFYELIAPKNSFIHAQDFDYDPVELSKYLQRVSSNFSLYAEYFKWKLNYEAVYSPRQCETRRLCELCTRLNTQKTLTYYESVSSWFNSDCFIN
jgi:hypothetical protein